MLSIKPKVNKNLTKTAAAIVFLAYLGVHLFTLSFHPFVHSDEAWLAVLSRAILVEGSPAAVEEVFRLTPRYPHALKTLYHLIQIPFIAISWSAVAARLPSLIAGLLSLYLIAKIGEEMRLGPLGKFAPALLMAVDPQFFYLAHLGRQEMLLIMLFLWALLCLLRAKPIWLTAMPMALGIFVHPGAAVFALALGSMLLFQDRSSTSAAEVNGDSNTDDPGPKLLLRKSLQGTVGRTLAYGAILGLAGLIALVISLVMDPGFIEHYGEFGSRVGAGDSFIVKALGFPRFLEKMWLRQSGTYFLPDIRASVVLGFAGFGAVLIRVLASKTRRIGVQLLAAYPAIALGIVIIGKYSPPSAGYFMPLTWLLFSYGIFGPTEAGKKNPAFGLLLLSCGVLAFISFGEIRRSATDTREKDYVEYLQEHVGDQERVLANLNTAFAFEYDRLVIWRDLEFLPGAPGSLTRFLDDSEVRWIVLPDELEYIYESRPVWNMIYGNPRWYPELESIIADRGTVLGSSVFPRQSMRIVPYVEKSQWALEIYRLDQ